MNNRKHNATNPNQGTTKRILCVCSAGLLRSPTLAHMLALEGYNTRSCGSSTYFALIPIDDVLIHWADQVVFVNEENYKETSKSFNLSDKEVVILNIPDQYERMDSTLQKVCLEQYNEAVSNVK